MKYSIAILALLGSTSAISIAKNHQQKGDDKPKVQTPDSSRESYEQHVKQADGVVSKQQSTEGSWLKEDKTSVDKAKTTTYNEQDKIWKARDRQNKDFHPTTTESLNQKKIYSFASMGDSSSDSSSSDDDEDVQVHGGLEPNEQEGYLKDQYMKVLGHMKSFDKMKEEEMKQINGGETVSAHQAPKNKATPWQTAALQLHDGPGLADKTFTENIKVADAVAKTQEDYEKQWLKEHKDTTSQVATTTQDKKLTNFRDREGVYQNNWHRKDEWGSKLLQLDDTEDADDIDFVEIGISQKEEEAFETRAMALSQEDEAPAEDKAPAKKEALTNDADPKERAKPTNPDGVIQEDQDTEPVETYNSAENKAAKADGLDSGDKDSKKDDAKKEEPKKEEKKEEEKKDDAPAENNEDESETDKMRKEAMAIVAKQNEMEDANVNSMNNSYSNLSKEVDEAHSKYYQNINANGRHDWGFPYSYYTYF